MEKTKSLDMNVILSLSGNPVSSKIFDKDLSEAVSKAGQPLSTV
jgi:hypothetical protein